jgi:hypothetical protein
MIAKAINRRRRRVHRHQRIVAEALLVSQGSQSQGETESNSEAVFGDSHHSRDSKSNDQLDRQVPYMPNCKLANTHERNPTVCSISPH